MPNEEIVEGIKVALSRGETLQKAMMSFYNAGYAKQDIEEAARNLQQPQFPSLNQQIQQPRQIQQVKQPTLPESQEKQLQSVFESKNQQNPQQVNKQQVQQVKQIQPIQQETTQKQVQQTQTQEAKQTQPAQQEATQESPEIYKTANRFKKALVHEYARERLIQKRLRQQQGMIKKLYNVERLQLAEPPKNTQKVSSYDEKPNKWTSIAIFVLIFVLLFLVAALVGIFLFKDEVTSFLNNLFG